MWKLISWLPLLKHMSFQAHMMVILFAYIKQMKAECCEERKKKLKSNRNLQEVGSFVVKEVFWNNMQQGIVQMNGLVKYQMKMCTWSD